KLMAEVPSITFKFELFSNSLFDVCVDPKIDGKIYFESQELVDVRTVRWPSDQIVHRGEGKFFIEQRLTEREAKLIATTEGRFRFNELNVTIKESPKTRMAFPKIKSGKLSITLAHSIAVREISSFRASE